MTQWPGSVAYNGQGNMMSDLTYFEQAEHWFGDALAEDAAQLMATLAIAEQLKRIADATERRNELLHEFNQANAQSAVEHTEAMNAGIKKMLDAFYGPDDSN